MSEGVQFDEDRLSSASRAQMAQSGSNAGDSAMVRWMMEHHLAKTPVMAQAILVAAIAVNLILTYVIIHFLF